MSGLPPRIKLNPSESAEHIPEQDVMKKVHRGVINGTFRLSEVGKVRYAEWLETKEGKEYAAAYHTPKPKAAPKAKKQKRKAKQQSQRRNR